MVRAAPCQSAPTRRCPARRENAHEPSSARGIARQLPPLAACLHHLQHRVHHPALFMLSRSASGVTPCPWFVQQRLQPHPLLIAQIARLHAPTLSTQALSAYSFQASFASFWTGSQEVREWPMVVGGGFEDDTAEILQTVEEVGRARNSTPVLGRIRRLTRTSRWP